MSVSTDGRQVKALLGIVPQEESLDPDLSVFNNLVVYAGYFGMSGSVARERAVESLREFQLLDRASSQVDELSGGMKRRLLIARGLINRPPIVLLDEPTTGLDPQARQAVWRNLRALQRSGVTLLLTTHYMEEAAMLCDRIVVMHEGTIVDGGTPADLMGRHAGETVVEVHSEDSTVLDAAAQALAASNASIEITEDVLYAFGLSADETTEVELGRFRTIVRPGNLEDVFLRLTGRGLQD
jgi:lipooligosaccharide transport system ATP-binding protein